MGARFIAPVGHELTKNHRLEDALPKQYETVLQKKVEKVMDDEMTKSVSALEFLAIGPGTSERKARNREASSNR